MEFKKAFEHATVCIEDKNGKHYNTLCSPDYTAPEIRNMQRHLELAAKNPKAFHFLDLPTARILVNGEPLPQLTNADLDLLDQLLEA